MERPLGALRDIPDQRDYLVRDILPESAVIPESVDYTSVYGEVRNQLQLGACVGFASAAMKEGQEHIDTGDHLVFSPLYIYWQRMGKQPGMYPREAMDILSSKGICLDKNLEYLRNMTEIGTVPSRLNAEAANYKISGYYRITTVNELRETLANYGPCFVSIGVTDSFNRLGSSGIWEYKEGEVVKGGHAVVAISYDDKTKLIKFRNSWGFDWGAKGYFYIRYDDLLKRAWDMYKAIDVKSTKYVAPSIFTRLKEVITWIVRKILHI